jgi:hypothetical protein
MKAEVKIITPLMAKTILEKNRNNRPLKKNTVNYYAIQMEKGLWRLTGQGISFDTNGKPLDGQHRLAAIVKANVSIELLIITDVEPDTFGNYDQGRNRTGSDIFALNNIPYFSSMASTVKSYVNMTINIDTRLGVQRSKLNYNEMVDIYNLNPDKFQHISKLAHKYYARYAIIARSTLGGIMAYITIDRLYPDDFVYKFFNQLYQYEDTNNKSIDSLRTLLIRNAANTKKYSKFNIINLISRAFNHYVNDIEVGTFRVPKDRVIISKYYLQL